MILIKTHSTSHHRNQKLTLDAPTSLNLKTINSDAGADAITLWTETGAKLKYVEDTSAKAENWLGNNWRYYVVFDSEGRIAYAVLHPLSGYTVDEE